MKLWSALLELGRATAEYDTSRLQLLALPELFQKGNSLASTHDSITDLASLCGLAVPIHILSMSRNQFTSTESPHEMLGVTRN
eukprot:1445234-Amphidinium_carterae.1